MTVTPEFEKLIEGLAQPWWSPETPEKYFVGVMKLEKLGQFNLYWKLSGEPLPPVRSSNLDSKLWIALREITSLPYGKDTIGDAASVLKPKAFYKAVIVPWIHPRLSRIDRSVWEKLND